MHELPVINSILKIVLRHAEDNNARKVVTVNLRVGELSDLEDQWMQKYFDHLSKDTVAAGATLKIERIPVVLKCDACGMSYVINIKADASHDCPACSSKTHTMVSGREYFIRDLEVI